MISVNSQLSTTRVDACALFDSFGWGWQQPQLCKCRVASQVSTVNRFSVVAPLCFERMESPIYASCPIPKTGFDSFLANTAPVLNSTAPVLVGITEYDTSNIDLFRRSGDQRW